MNKPNRRRKFNERGRRKRPMPMDGAGNRRIPGIWAERAKAPQKRRKKRGRTRS